MAIKIGTSFEVEIRANSLWLKVGGFERFYNTMGLDSH